MSKRYPGNFITGNPVALSQTSNNGVWDLKDNYAAVGNNTWQEADGYYEIPRSLRFRRSATTYLTKVAGTPTSQNIWTISMWVKLGLMADVTSTNGGFFSANQVGNPNESIKWGGMGEGNGAKIYYQSSTSGGTNNITRFIDLPLRDPSAWYHLVFQKNGSCNSGVKFFSAWINGVAVASFSGGYSGTQASVPDYINISGNTFNIGGIGGANTLDCHMAEVNFVDGQALDASYFGYKDSVTGIWQPKKYTGAYGNNGFYLPFNQYTSPIMLGKNSGNPSNLCIYSEQLDNAVWVKPASPVAPVVTANAAIAPNGTLTADLVTFAGATTHPVLQEVTVPSFTVGDTYTASIYLKTSVAGTYNLQLVYFLTAGGNQDSYCQVTFNSSGVLTSFQPITTAISCTAVNVGDGWYRVSVSSKWTLGGAGTTLRMSIGQGSGASSIYAWGGQINLGEGPDAYLQTVASAVNQSLTVNNFSVTAGATNDSMVDSPTNVFTTATDIGGVVPGNYCTLSPVNRSSGGGTLSEGNLRITTSGGNHTVCGTMAFPTSGKWYFEATDTVTGGNSAVGIFQQNQSLETNVISANINMKYTNMADNATFGIAVDMDNLTYTLYKSGVIASSGSASTGSLVAGVTYVPFCMTSAGGGASTTFNFGQRPFAYAPPTGYKSLNTTNIQALGSSGIGKAAIQPNKWFDAVSYGGTGAARTITNPGGFIPDLIWTKVRNTTYSHNLADSVRGAGVRLYIDGSAVEAANPAGGITSFNTTNNNGYNIDGGVEVNENGRPYVSWQWKQSPDSGFNIISYTGTGVARTISHNLGIAPRYMIIKQRDVSARSWCVYHEGLSNPQAAFYADSSSDPFAYTGFFNNTAPSSSGFSLGTDASVNQSGSAYIAYLWAEVPGFSKFGNYSGTGAADGPFIYTGFRPKYIMVRHSNLSTGVFRDWLVFDSTRSPYNGWSTSDTTAGAHSFSSGAAYTGASGYSDAIDIVSNGFKFRNGASPNYNGSGETYVFSAFAESPFALNNRAR